MQTTYSSDARSTVERAFAAERPRLLRLCAHLVGDVGAAEDVVQDTLLEAWRQQHRVHDWREAAPWLTAIARYMCLRWHRHQGQEWRYRAPVSHASRAALDDATATLADPFDLEVELERHELATLLDRALALLPPDARMLLIQKYVERSPHADIAAHLGISEGAVAMRLQRGKLAFRRVLTTQLHAESAAYGLAENAQDTWQETRIWCPHCGNHCLLVHLPQPPGTVAFRCPGCCTTPHETDAEYPLTNAHFLRLIGGLQRPRAILNRTATWADSYFRHALAQRAALCTHCNRPANVHIPPMNDDAGNAVVSHVLYVVCIPCSVTTCVSFQGLILNLPSVQHFWRYHGRIRTLPPYPVEAAGQPALVTRLESIDSVEQLAIVTARATFDVISMHRTGTAIQEQS